MNKHNVRRGIYWAGAVIIIAAIVLYINRSYAYIYNYIDGASLKSSDRIRIYQISNNPMASSSLIYVALGDSLTAGVGVEKYSESFPYLFAQSLSGNNYQVTLKDRAVPGAKTKDLLNGLLPAAIRDNPDIVTVLIGVNDVHNNTNQAEFRASYENIIMRLTKETKAKIYLINIPFIGADNLILPPHNYLFDARTKQYNEIIQELALKYRVKYIDLYTPTKKLFTKSGSHYAADLFHPSAEGYKIWADLIYANFNQ